MQLDSVRELKQQVLKKILRPMLAASPQALRLPYAAAPLAVTQQTPRLMALGVARAGKRGYRLAVRLQRRSLAARPELDRLRRMAHGEIDLRYVGRVHKRAVPWHQGRGRPLAIGSSIAHFDITAGTLGAFVKAAGSADGSATFLLSNNHVFANENRAWRGAAIYQPAPFDGGSEADTVATLDSFVRLVRGTGNLVDGAIAAVVDGIGTDPGVLRGLGRLRGVSSEPADVGLGVAKVGRTTGVTRGRISAFELDDVVVEFGIGNLSFDDQIEIEALGEAGFSDGGDSGSLIVDTNGFAVGLLFAGSESGGRNGKGVTFANPIGAVLEKLRVELIY